LAKIFKSAGPWGKRPKPKRSWLVSELYRFLAATAFLAIVIGYFYFDEILPEVRNWLRPAGNTIIGRATVIDGDTIEIHSQRIRLNGIDAPESAQFCKDEKGEEYHPCGRHSSNFLAKLLAESSPTRCETMGRDQYRRLIGNCFRADGQDVATAIVRAGYAMDWPRHSGGARASEQEEAKTKKLGLWAYQFEPPWEYRARYRIQEQQAQEPSKILPPIKKPSSKNCRIKGNISVSTGERIYHVPGQKYYDETVISVWKGEQWFCSEAEARAAGWRKARV
jgi:endonuclease YncB( thermonuclease family)